MFRYILPICLPPTNLPITGKKGFVTGWGEIYENGPNPPVPNQVLYNFIVICFILTG